MTSRRGMWLIGSTSTEIVGSKLPSNRQILSRFLQLHRLESKTIQESAKTTTEELLVFWEKARVPTRQQYHIISKVKELFSEYQNLRKNASRRSGAQVAKEEKFKENNQDHIKQVAIILKIMNLKL